MYICIHTYSSVLNYMVVWKNVRSCKSFKFHKQGDCFMIIKCLSGKFFPKTTKMTPPSTEERISVNEDPVKSLHFENEGGGGLHTMVFYNRIYKQLLNKNNCSRFIGIPPPQKKKKKRKKKRDLMPLISFDIPWKHQKTTGFLMFSWGGSQGISGTK